MFDDSNIIVGLEIGTSKICAVVGEQTTDGSLNIVGLGQSPRAACAKARSWTRHRPRNVCATPLSRPNKWPTWKSAVFIWA